MASMNKRAMLRGVKIFVALLQLLKLLVVVSAWLNVEAPSHLKLLDKSSRPLLKIKTTDS